MSQWLDAHVPPFARFHAPAELKTPYDHVPSRKAEEKWSTRVKTLQTTIIWPYLHATPTAISNQTASASARSQ